MKVLTAFLSAGIVFAAGPPCKIGDVVRAGALNYDAKIMEFDAAKGLYKVVYVTGYKGDVEWLAPKSLKTCTAPEIAAVKQEWFAGQWELFTGGGGAYVKSQTTGDWKAKALDVAKAPPLVILQDGTYVWKIDSTRTARGQWRLALQNELKYGYEKLGTAIILLKGEDDKDWLVTRELTSTNDGRDRILIERKDLGLTYRGNRK